MGVSATLFLIAIVRKYFWDFDSRKTKVGTLSVQFGFYSMGVYLIQTLLLEYTLKKFVSFDAMNSWLLNIVVAPVFAIIILLLCVAFIRLVNKKRWASLALFGTNYVT